MKKGQAPDGAEPNPFAKPKKGVGTKKAKTPSNLPMQGKAPAKAGPKPPGGPIDPATLGSMTSSLKGVGK